jgi:group II intron reverse transcriptase/maturase
LSLEGVSTKLQRIAELARKAPGMVITTLSHHIDVEWLREAFRRTRKDGAVGVDGQSAKEYAQDLEGNLCSLLERFKSGRYKAPPVRRVYIPKGDGKKKERAIGVPSFEDKVLQRAVTMAMEAVYEQDFLECSYGSRPARSAHQALEALRDGLMELRGGWVVELDIQKYFDNLDHGHLRRFLDQRVRDGVLRRAIDKWLKAGVLEEGCVKHPDTGTPQGGVISPLLANIYLHEILDKWFEETVKPRLTGRAVLVRYMDDAVMVFDRERDASRVMDVLPKRFGKYGLTLHPDKTRVVRFVRPRGGTKGKGESNGQQPGTFDFLGFTHYWGKSRKGYWVVKWKTSRERFRRSLRKIGLWCRQNRHLKVKEQHRILVQKLRGHYAYYGITFNAKALGAFRYKVGRVWQKWLSRRSHKGRIPWDKFNLLVRRHPLPAVVMVHSRYRRVANP